MKFTALIVDDEELTRNTIKTIGLWEKFNIELIGEASDGYQALRFITDKRPDIVLLDMRMPGIDGIDLMKELERINHKVKIIIISGYDDYVYTHEAIKYGAKDYILKPIDRDELNAALQRIKALLEKEKDNNERLNEYYGWTEDIPNRNIDIISMVYEFIARNYSKDISLQILSNTFYLNKEFLSRAFKKRYGIGITSFINQNRLNKAAELLKKGCKINDTAEAVGFNDVNYFSRQFKKYFNMTPSEYVDRFRAY